MKATPYYDYNVGLPHKAKVVCIHAIHTFDESWQEFFGRSHLTALVSA